MKSRTSLKVSTPLNTPILLEGLKKIGARIDYATERTVDFMLEGVRMRLGHNWEDERYVTTVSVSHKKVGIQLEERIRVELENTLV